MARTPSTQLFETLSHASRVLLVLPAVRSTDHIAAAGAVLRIVAASGIPTDAYGEGFVPEEALAIVPETKHIQGTLPPLSGINIRLPLTHTKLHDLSYRATDTELTITITPKSGGWQSTDVGTRVTADVHDLIVAVGVPDIPALGHVADTQAELFSRLPIINIDCTPENEHYGTINIVDTRASSICEVLTQVFSQEKKQIDTATATALLAGMVAATRRFTTGRISPATLTAAGDLMAHGAEHELVVHALYRTRTVETLRLWGRTLARLKSDPSLKLVWSVLTHQDIALSGASRTTIPDAMDELMATTPDADIACILFEQPSGTVSAVLDARRPHDARRLAAPWKPHGTATRVRWETTAPLPDAEAAFLSHIRNTRLI